MASSTTLFEFENGGLAAKLAYDINVPSSYLSGHYYDGSSAQRTEFPQYLPHWDPQVWFDEVLPFEYVDPAFRADEKMPNLLKPGVQMKHLTPKMGTILMNVKLEELSNAARDELALLISKRKVVLFRDQLSFLRSGPQFQEDFMSYYGKLAYQPVSGTVKGFPAFHIVHRDNNEEEIATFFQRKTTSTLWHHDGSSERQPPGYVMLAMLACPEFGGDTVFADTAEAYKRLSPAFQNFINGLTAMHSSRRIIGLVKARGGMARSEPVDSLHPIVRVHPITGEKVIYINDEFVTGIENLKEQESEVIVKFLVDHICKGHDFQARVPWEKHSVVMFDGRNTLHTASVDYDTRAHVRHIFRLAAMTEKPMSVAESERVAKEDAMLTPTSMDRASPFSEESAP